MDPDATWAIITSVDSTPQERRDAALHLLMWLANYGYTPGHRTERPLQRKSMIDTCGAVIIAEFEYADRLAGR